MLIKVRVFDWDANFAFRPPTVECLLNTEEMLAQGDGIDYDGLRRNAVASALTDAPRCDPPGFFMRSVRHKPRNKNNLAIVSNISLLRYRETLYPLDGSTLLSLSREQIETCAALLGCDADTPALVAMRFGVSRWAIYKRRSRAEKALGTRFPRMSRKQTYAHRLRVVAAA